MTLAWVAAVLAAALAVSGGVTELVRRRAVRRADYDVPNERSSHAVPTPRGGGLGIVVAVTAGGTALAWGGRMEWRTWLAVALPGLLVALVGWLDDRGRVRVASVRLALHAVAAVALVTALGGLPPLTLTDGPVDLGWAGHALAVVYVVWMLNLFNFMDGIDGITAVEAMAVCACVVGVEVLAGAGNELLAPPALVAAASAGFLVYNWPPARIFLGDVGSGYVGYLLAALSLVSLGMAALTSAGLQGAALQMLNHGVSSAMMFLIVGIVYERAHHRDLDRFGGMGLQMPYYTGFAIVGFFASLGLPGLNGFISEFFVFQGAFQSESFWAGNSIVYGMPRWIVYAALPGIVLTAGYILWTIQRVFLGKVTDHHYLEFKDLSARETLILIPFAFLCVYLGVQPQILMGYMDGSLKALQTFVTTKG